MESIIQQVDNLILLVGENPMPNAVAARLQAKPGGKIGLLYTPDVSGIKKRLSDFITRKANENHQPAPVIRDSETSESDPQKIRQAMERLLNNLKIGPLETLCLHYTGGTKSMAAHAYRAVEKYAIKNRIKTSFSYLDARNLELIIEAGKVTDIPIKIKAGPLVKISFKDMMNLHGMAYKKDKKAQLKEPKTTPVYEESAKLIAGQYCTADNQYWEWLQTQFYRQYLKFPIIEPLIEDTDNPVTACKDYIENHLFFQILKNCWERKKVKDSNKKKIELNWDKDQMDFFSSLEKELLRESGLSHDGPLTIGNLAKSAGISAENMCKWFDGEWLESYLLLILNDLKEKLDLNEVLMSIEADFIDGSANFEFDVIAIKNYQLFAFSCTSDKSKHLNKSKLMECEIRAKQLGGDEARTALVCCYDKDPKILESEISSQLPHGSTKIKVFGAKHLQNLSDYIEEWIKTNSKEETAS